NNGAYCLARPGEIYAVYLPKEGTVTVKLEAGTYEASWFSAFTGERVSLPPIQGPKWTSPKTPGWLDWALLIRKVKPPLSSATVACAAAGRMAPANDGSRELG